MEITWKITNLQRRASDGFVQSADWRCTAVDGEYSASGYSFCEWKDGVPSIPYDQLTEAQVLNWIWSSGEANKESVEAAMISQIEAQKKPLKISGLPW